MDNSALELSLPYARRPTEPEPARWQRHPRELDTTSVTDVRPFVAAVLATYTDVDGVATAVTALVRTAVWAGGDRPPAECGLVVDVRDRARLRVWHDPASVAPAAVERVLDDLARALADPSDITPAEVSEAIGAARTFTADTTVLAAIERHARTTPDAIAVLSGEHVLTYAELERRAAALAGRLLALGAHAETHVVLLLPPTVDFAVAAVAAFKAGAVFVPVDPEYPRRRVHELMAAVPGAITMTTAAFESLVPEGHPCLRVDAGTGSDGVVAGSVRVAADSAACALFTSASTGNSKAVVITHGGLLNLAHCAIERLGLTARDRFLQLASPSFSGFLEEAFPSLVAGGSLVLAGYQAGMPSVQALVSNLARYEVTAFGIAAAHWHHLVDHLTETGTALPSRLRLVLLGCERPLPDRVAAWREQGVPLVFVYGPTEATATATYYLLELGSSTVDLPVGAVIPNTRLYLCDRELRRVPHGVPGEVYLGGVSLARGYLDAPGLTADRFVPDPFGTPGTRLYRTGDLARFLPDGNLEFLNRDANLIKVRGCRINPAEVEATLERHPAVARAVVVARPDAHGADELVGFLRLRAGPELDRGAVRAFVADRLPGFMVPSALVAVDGFPLNANGKTDRRALVTEEVDRVATEHVAPGTDTERVVAEVWADVLGLPRVGLADHFFELGGNSLQVLRVASRLRERFGVELRLPDIFGAPTVARLAELVDARSAAADQGAAIDVDRLRSRRWLISQAIAQRTGIEGATPIALAQQGLWFVTQVQQHGPLYTTAFRCALRGELDLTAMRAAADAVFARHDSLRTGFTLAAGQPLQVVADPAGGALTVMDVPGADPADRRASVEKTCAAIASEGIDPTRPPLCRLVLMPVDRDEHVLLAVLHHLVCDHHSEAILLRDLAAAYTAHMNGTPAALPELPLRYQDFTIWQRARLQQRTELLEYWRGQLAGYSTVELPYDTPRAPDHDFAGASMTVTLTDAHRSAVRRIAADRSVTPHTVLLAAFFVLLYRRTGAADLCVGAPFANRVQPELEQMIGYFVNMVGLRVDVTTTPTFEALLERVRQVTVDAYDHQELPFHLAVREVRGHARAPGATPLFQAAFTLDDDPAAGVTAPGLHFGPVSDVRTGKVGLDLVFLLVNRPHEIELTVDYSTRLFHLDTVRGMVADYLAILDRVRDNIAVSLAELTGADRVPVVEAMQTLWAAAFGFDGVGVDDDFFEMGGSSLLAAQIVASLSELLGVGVTLRMFFESATIRELADRIAGEHAVTTVGRERLAKIGAVGSMDELVAGVHELSDMAVDLAVGVRPADDEPARGSR